jgi:hypothetical protein
MRSSGGGGGGGGGGWSRMCVCLRAVVAAAMWLTDRQESPVVGLHKQSAIRRMPNAAPNSPRNVASQRRKPQANTLGNLHAAMTTTAVC